MKNAAKERLCKLNIQDIAKNAGVELKDDSFCFMSLGKSFTLNAHNFTLTPAADPWQTLIILHYLAFADGTPLMGEEMSFAQYKDGVIRGVGFIKDADDMIRMHADKFSLEQLEKKCRDMGAEIIPSTADICARFYFLPRYPLTLKLWQKDDEFPASGQLLPDKSAQCYLPLEDAITAGDIILRRLFEL